MGFDDNNIHEEELHFHYNRENRLKNAPDIVKSHYDGTEKLPPKGIFKSLVHTKASRYLLGSIVLLVLMIVFVTNVPTETNAGTLYDIPFSLSAFVFDDNTFVTLSAEEIRVDKDFPIVIIFKALNNDGNIIQESSYFPIYYGNEDSYVTTFANYDIITIEAEISIEDEILMLSTKVQK